MIIEYCQGLWKTLFFHWLVEREWKDVMLTVTHKLKEESSDKEATYESNKNCIAKCNENEEGETDGHNDDIDAINLFNAKNV